jgi:hypothetical protein
MEPRNGFQGMNSASVCSLAGRYDNPIPPRFLAPMDSLKIPAPFLSFLSLPETTSARIGLYTFLYMLPPHTAVLIFSWHLRWSLFMSDTNQIQNWFSPYPPLSFYWRNIQYILESYRYENQSVRQIQRKNRIRTKGTHIKMLKEWPKDQKILSIKLAPSAPIHLLASTMKKWGYLSGLPGVQKSPPWYHIYSYRFREKTCFRRCIL